MSFDAVHHQRALVEPQPGFLHVRAVAVEAVLHQQRPHVFLEELELLGRGHLLGSSGGADNQRETHTEGTADNL